MNVHKVIKHFDWLLFSVLMMICFFGLSTLYSASTSFAFDNTYFEKQLLWFGVSLIVFFLVLFLDYQLICRSAYVFYALMLLLLFAMDYLGLAEEQANVKRWIKIGSVSIQPSELSKIILALTLAQYFSESKRVLEFGWKEILVPSLLTFSLFFLIAKQPDLGTAMILMFILLAILFIVGLPYKVIFISLGISVLTFPIIWQFVLKAYQKKRIFSLFDPDSDPLGSGYHLIQSKIAIGSSGYFGKGFLNGSQAQLNFLPTRHTDFIFSVFSEEWGFFGSALLIILYGFLLYLCLNAINIVNNRTGVILIIGLVALISSHVIINIGMVTGLLPVVGMPLPFFSYGGSSMLVMMISVALIMNIKIRSQENLYH